MNPCGGEKIIEGLLEACESTTQNARSSGRIRGLFV
jgi:hypothetical protein